MYMQPDIIIMHPRYFIEGKGYDEAYDDSADVVLSLVGETAAIALEQATAHGQQYISIEELQQASGVSGAIMESLRRVGALGDLPETSQVSFFG